MEFTKFKGAIQKHFAKMSEDVDHIYEVDVNKDTLWQLYLNSFPAGTNEIYRVRRVHDCGCCRQFIRAIGNVVFIKDSVVHTIWELDGLGSTYQPVADALDAYIKAHDVTDVYISKFQKIGTDKNHEQLPDGTVHTWGHFYLELPAKFVDKSRRSTGDLKGPFRDTKNVFMRSLEEITDDAVDTVLELIAQKSLYKGEEWQHALEEFKRYKALYAATPEELRNNFAWEQSMRAGIAVGRIRNHSMGTLLVNISQGMELDEAVRKYEAIVAPTNYKRPKAIYTKKMLEDAKNTITELGYLSSLGRRFATLDDITVNNILFSNRDAAKRIQSANDIFGEMEREISVDPKKFSRVQEITIEDFVKNVLPSATSVETLLENRHAASMVSLIAPADKDSKTMFKWNNGFSWAYSGNITDSNIRENVKMAGGKVDGVLRFSIQWNDEDFCPNDYDAHCMLPAGYEIFFGRKQDAITYGELDVDIINPRKGVPAVENIIWPSMEWMKKGIYRLFVHCYTNRGGRSGFKAEVEFGGTIYPFEYKKALRQNEVVDVAEVTYDPATGFSIKELLPSSLSTRDIWGLKSNQFVPVSVIMYSPNYWDEQDGIGHRHYFFMLKDCVNPERPNGFYNEFLKPELEQHRRVFEALGSKAAVQDVKDQLSGLGFSATKRNSLFVKVKGATERILKIIF